MNTPLAHHKQQIIKEIETKGPFSHNLVSITLRQVAREHGQAKANKLIKELELDDLFGILPRQ